MDLSSLLAAVDFGSTIVSILAVALVILGVAVLIFAVSKVLSMVNGRVYYGGQWWDKDVYETALKEVKFRARKGELVDAESRKAVKEYEGLNRSRRSSSIGSTRI